MLTINRINLDKFLEQRAFFASGKVLDIGGKKIGRRGSFAPPLKLVGSWFYLNIDELSKPDILASAEYLPIYDNAIDTFYMIEVLELVRDPYKAISEAHRVLKPGGYGFITIPFLYPIHDEPYDMQRWTQYKLIQVCNDSSFDVVEMQILGGAFSAMFSILHACCWRSSNSILFKVFAKCLEMTRWIFVYLDERNSHLKSVIPSGIGMVVRKKQLNLKEPT